MNILMSNNTIKTSISYQNPEARTAHHAPKAPPLYPHDHYHGQEHHHSQEHHHGHHQQEDVKYRTMPQKDAFKDELKSKMNK